MSTSLAIGAVTAVLRRQLENSIVDHDLPAILGLPAEQQVVSTLPPDRVAAGQAEPSRLNLFLFQATENAAWRNADFPSRNGRGERTSNPRLALDLCYLLTAHGATALHADVLLGHAMFVFHETPVLTRQAIRDALGALVADDPSDLTNALAAAHLAEQIEQIKIVPRVMNVEEISKIWTALQSPYRPSAAYQISVVLIEPVQPARSALPVLTRGEWLAALNRDAGVFVHAGTGSPVPLLEAIAFPNGAAAARIGDVIVCHGQGLAGTNVRARFHEARSDAVLELAAEPDGGAETFSVQLPQQPPAAGITPSSPLHPANWRAGIYEVSALVTIGAREYETGRVPLVLAPRVDALTPNVAGGALVSITVSCSPPVRPAQDVVLIVRDVELRPDARTAPADTLEFPAPADSLAAGTYPTRLRVDGIESVLVDRQTRPPRFAPSQILTIP